MRSWLRGGSSARSRGMAAAAAAAAQQQQQERLARLGGGAASLTLDNMGELIGLLTSGLSADGDVRKPAEAMLEQWRELPGYFSLLKEVVVLAEAPLEVRWLGACCFKNGIKRSWRRAKHLSGGITDAEKAHLRTHLLLLLDVVDERIAKQVAEIICQVARLEFPKAWPELLPAIVGRLDAAYAMPAAEGLARARVILRALHSVVRELSTKRLKADRLAFEELSTGLFPRVQALWAAQSEALLAASTAAEARVVLADIVKYCAKILRMLLLAGMSDFHAVDGALQHVTALPRCLQVTVDAYTQLVAEGGGAGTPFAKKLLKVVLAMSTTALELMRELPGACWECGSVRPYLDLFRATLRSPCVPGGSADGLGDNGRGALEPLHVDAMLFIMQVLKAEENATADVISACSPEGAHITAAAAARQAEALAEFFSVEVIAELLSLAVCRWLVLTPAEIEACSEDPEQFLKEQEELWEGDDIQPCAESLVSALFEQRPDTTLPLSLGVLAQLIDAPLCEPGSAVGAMALGPQGQQAAAAIKGMAESEGLRLKLLQEAALHLVGSTAYHLAEHLNFETWYTATLLPMVVNGSGEEGAAENATLRRRIVWLLGKWCSAGALPTAARPSLYSALVGLLAEQDLALALTSAQTLNELINDFGFEIGPFAVYAPQMLTQVLGLLERTDEGESKMTAMQVLTLLIERLGDHAQTFAPAVAAALPEVWNYACNASGAPGACDESSAAMVKAGVVRATTQLTLALGGAAEALYGFSVPVAAHCVDLGHPDHVYLLDDGIALWSASLQNATSMSGPLLELWARVGPILNRDFDNLLELLQMMGGYMLLGGTSFMSLHAADVVAILDGVLTEVRDRGQVAVAECAELLLQVFPNATEGPALLAGLAGRMLEILLQNRELADTVVSAFTLVCGRLLTLDPPQFWQLIGELCSSSGCGGDLGPLLDRLLEVWLPAPDGRRGITFAAPMPPLQRRKLHASAALTLMSGPPGAAGGGETGGGGPGGSAAAAAGGGAGGVASLAASVALPRLGLAVRAVVGVLTAEGINAADDAAADTAAAVQAANAASNGGVGGGGGGGGEGARVKEDTALLQDGTVLRDCAAERKRALFARDPVRIASIIYATCCVDCTTSRPTAPDLT